jgi:phosphoribosylformimino-5-aminoimidazole carboxamide ribotide isomerase
MLTRQGGLHVIPAVDVLDGEAVRLKRGAFDRVVTRRSDPLALVREFAASGAELIHLVDLGAARSGRVDTKLVADVVAAAGPVAVQAAGGVRSGADAEALLGAGARRVVVGTAAFADDGAALEGYASALGDRLVVALDVRDGAIAVDGWERSTTLDALDAVDRCRSAGVRRIACTAIERDGTLAGPDVELLERVCGRAGIPVLAAGGIRSLEDLHAVESAGCEGAIVGRALLDGQLPLSVLAGARQP